MTEPIKDWLISTALMSSFQFMLQDEISIESTLQALHTGCTFGFLQAAALWWVSRYATVPSTFKHTME